jgi:HSP20 family protein
MKFLMEDLMAQEVKKPEPATTPAPRPVDPFSAMRAEMDRVFDNFLGGRGWLGMPEIRSGSNTGRIVPSVDVRENDKEIIVEAELPGMEQDDVDVTLRDGMLTVKGEKKSERKEEKDDFHITERSYGSFQRSFRLPDTVDEEKITANLENGVLRVTLQKKPEAVKAEKKITIAKK